MWWGAFEREALVFGGIIVDAIGADAIVFWPMSALLSVGSSPVPAGKGGLVKERHRMFLRRRFCIVAPAGRSFVRLLFVSNVTCNF
jgi:hypothetical protein